MTTETANNHSRTADRFPPGLKNAFLFAVFNAFSFQIILNSPMVLYAKTLDATATVLGIITGMMPLLVIFQIPAAHYVSRVGFKRFVYAGWGTRVTFIFAMALVPLTSAFLDKTSRLGLLLMLLFGFNLSRGISSAAWLPWITSLVPAGIRGRYLAADAACVNVASFVTFLLAALCLGRDPRAWQFAALFAFSAITGALSLVFLKRIPDVAAAEEIRTSSHPVPWREMILFPPFWKLVRMVIFWSVAYGGMTAFTVAYLKTKTPMTEAEILLVTSISFLGGLSSLWFLGSRLDHLGSKPVLSFSFLTWLLVALGWLLPAGKILSPSLPLILALQFFMGLFASLVQMSNTRLAMAIVPAMGRNHFFALFSVLSNLSLGLAPILWGLLIDAIGPRHVFWLYTDWNDYSVFFAAVCFVFVMAFGLARRLEEPQAASMEALLKEILVESPQRVWFKLWPRG